MNLEFEIYKMNIEDLNSKMIYIKEELTELKTKHSKLNEELEMEKLRSKKKTEKLDNHNKDINTLKDYIRSLKNDKAEFELQKTNLSNSINI